MKQSNRMTPPVFRIALLAVCALLLSSRLVGGLYARYAAQIEASDSGRVAKFAFTDSLTDQFMNVPVSLAPGEWEDVTVTFENRSDVTIRYVIRMENLTGNLPLVSQSVISDPVAPGGSGSVNLRIEWPATENSPDQIGLMDELRIVVSAEQVD